MLPELIKTVLEEISAAKETVTKNMEAVTLNILSQSSKKDDLARDKQRGEENDKAAQNKQDGK
eukprot:893761-Ditylum_brightwellii.AAC.1